MRCGQANQIFFSVLVASEFARDGTQRCERQFVVGVHRENFLIQLDRLFAVSRLHYQVAIQLKSIGIFRVKRQRIMHILQRTVGIAGIQLDLSTQAEKVLAVLPAEIQLRDL